MIHLTFLQNYAPLLILLVSFILIYAALKKLSIPGNDATLAVLSLLISLIFVASKSAVNYIFSLIPFLSVILVISMIILILLVLTAKQIDDFKKPLAIIGFALAIILALGFAFNQFSTLSHMLPGTTNSGLDTSLSKFKHWMYSDIVVETAVFAVCIVVVWIFMMKKAGK
jgi:hypothetical protein